MLPEPSHLGVVVKNLDDAVRHFEMFGWGPFQTQEIDMRQYPHFVFRGQPADGRFRAAIGRAGSVLVELFQPLEGRSPYAEFAESKGEGIHHLGFHVKDFEGAWAALIAEGMEPVFHGRSPKRSFAYFGTDAIGGTVFEILNFSPSG